mgnify:CR=1 FL=1
MRSVSLQFRTAILILSAGIGLFILIPGQDPQHEDPVPLREHIDPVLSAGSTAYLYDDGRSVGVGADVETFTALAHAVATKDRKAYEHLFHDGRAFLVTDRVPVLVINLQGGRAEVRFLEGYHSGKSGFVIREWLKFTPD